MALLAPRDARKFCDGVFFHSWEPVGGPRVRLSIHVAVISDCQSSSGGPKPAQTSTPRRPKRPPRGRPAVRNYSHVDYTKIRGMSSQENPSKWWAASRPNYWKGFPGRRGRPEQKNQRVPVLVLKTLVYRPAPLNRHRVSWRIVCPSTHQVFQFLVLGPTVEHRFWGSGRPREPGKPFQMVGTSGPRSLGSPGRQGWCVVRQPFPNTSFGLGIFISQ
jgi:hypothetical protein